MIPFVPVKPAAGGRPLGALYRRLARDPAWVAQAKLDGHRAIWDGRALWSRQGRRITRAPAAVAALAGLDITLDGELMRSGVYWVFDLPDHAGVLAERWVGLEEIVAGLDSEFVQLMPSGVCWADVGPAGWEGVVVKRLASRYPLSPTPNWIKYRAVWL